VFLASLCSLLLSVLLTPLVLVDQLQLNDVNTVKPYPQHAEHCPSLPPKYQRPANC
jgi:hypothetical protein